MPDDHEAIGPAAEAVGRLNLKPDTVPSAGKYRWAVQSVVVKAIALIAVILLMIGALLLILQNAFKGISG